MSMGDYSSPGHAMYTLDPTSIPVESRESGEMQMGIWELLDITSAFRKSRVVTSYYAKPHLSVALKNRISTS